MLHHRIVRSITRTFACAAMLALMLALQGAAFAGFAGFGTATILDFVGNNSAKSMATGDVDGDGDTDVLAGDGSTNSIRVFFNDGSGSFTLVQSISSGFVGDLELDDLDGDGDLDLMFTNSAGVMTCTNSAGTFSAPTTAAGAAFSPSAVELLDLDGDGDVDGVTIPSLRPIVNSAGAFSVLPSAGATGANSGFATIDVDADGDEDIVVNAGAAMFRVFQNNSDPLLVSIFTQLGDFPFGTNAASSHELAVADLNGDGILDLAKGQSINNVDIALGNGLGGFTSVVTDSGSGSAQGPVAVAIVAWLNPSGGSPDKVRVFLNNGDATFAFQDYFITVSLDLNLSAIELSDVNEDGSPDIILLGTRTSPSGNILAVMLNQTAAIPPLAFDLQAPGDGTIVSLNPITPKLAWSQAGGFEVSYTVTIAREADLSDTVLVQGGVGDTCFSTPDGALEPGRLYYWGVTATNPVGSTGSTTPSLSFSTRIPADINGDGVVDTADLGQLIAAFGSVPN